MAKAIDMIREQYITEHELSELLGVDSKRIRDLRSFHVNGKTRFIDHIKPSGRCQLYRYEDVLSFLKSQPICSFGKGIGQVIPDIDEEE